MNYVNPFDWHVSAITKPLGRYYVHYLWRYTPQSWVGRTAYAFRVIAALIALPFVILTLLDIAAYVIVRTLGVVDDARTSNPLRCPPVVIPLEQPTIMVSSELPTPPDAITTTTTTTTTTATTNGTGTPTPYCDHPLDKSKTSPPQTFFTSDENVLRLSGVGVFSPAASKPPSPTCNRRPTSDLGCVMTLKDVVDRETLSDEIGIRRRTASHGNGRIR